MEEAKMLRGGKVGVIPTDTLYGVVAAALNEEAVKRVYTLKTRTPSKPCIILISSVDDLGQFGIELSDARRELLAKYWPGPVSIVMSCGKAVPEYLHRGTHTLAFRLPDDSALISFLRESGPLIAPSANPEGLSPAATIEEAKKYFESSVDFYLDGGVRSGAPSTIISIGEDDAVTVIREGRQLV